MRWKTSKEARQETLIEKAERQKLVEDIRSAEREWRLAEWRFHDALGPDHVDYAISCLEAAERRLDILLRQAKRHWSRSRRGEEGAEPT